MNCAIVSVGTDVLACDTLNIDINELSQHVDLLGFNVLYHIIIKDDIHEKIDTLSFLDEKCDLILFYGDMNSININNFKSKIINIEDNLEPLYEVVGKKLIERGLTISSAESCTAGLFVATLAKVPGISKVLKESYITYSNDIKTKILGVKKETLEKYTEVSKETASEMASGLWKITGSDISISVTGLAGPLGGTKEIPVGTVYIGLCYKGKTSVEHLNIDNISREYIRKEAVFRMFKMIDKVI